MAGIGGIAAILASWGMGLFEAKDQPPVPTLPIGQSVAAGEWALRFERAEVSDRLPDGEAVSRSGRKAIVLYLEATNRTAQTSGTLTQAIALATPVRGVDARPMAYLLRDQAVVTELQPGLPERIALVWTYPAGERAGATARFGVTARTFKPFDNLYAQPIWTDPHTFGTVDLSLDAPPPASSAGEP